jgi:hypothetical protein
MKSSGHIDQRSASNSRPVEKRTSLYPSMNLPYSIVNKLLQRYFHFFFYLSISLLIRLFHTVRALPSSPAAPMQSTRSTISSSALSFVPFSSSLIYTVSPQQSNASRKAFNPRASSPCTLSFGPHRPISVLISAYEE